MKPVKRVRYLVANSSVKILKCRATTVGGGRLAKADTSGKNDSNDTSGD